MRNEPPYPIERNKNGTVHKDVSEIIKLSVKSAKEKADKIYAEVEKYKNGGSAGNQNCQLCTWSMEMQFRGENMLPRLVYSPRDVELTLNGYEVVKNPVKKRISNKDNVRKIVEDAGENSRFYMYVNWNGSTGGHEFVVVNINGKPYVVDGQAGIVSEFGSKEANKYFDDINYKNSFMVRMDDKPINRDILKYNDRKYLTEWDQVKDIQFMYEHDMLTDSDLEEFWLSKRKSDNKGVN